MQTSRRAAGRARLLLSGLLLAGCEQGPTDSIILFPDPSGGSGASFTGGANSGGRSMAGAGSGGILSAGGATGGVSSGGAAGRSPSGGATSGSGGASSGGAAGKSSGGSAGGCTINTDCATTTRYCDTTVHACLVCTEDSQCDSKNCEQDEGHCAR